METLTLDIETLGTNRPEVRDYIAASITPPGVMKKAESIAAWNAEQRPAAIDEAVAKTSLDGAFGRVCVIGWTVGDDVPESVSSAVAEVDVLRDFAETLAGLKQHSLQIVGHNVPWDIRFLVQRYIVNRIKPPVLLTRAVNAKPWETAIVFDTMTQWAGPRGTVSLEKLCLALGVPSPKTDIDGSMVGQAVADGRIAEVAAYCCGDVMATRECWRLMTFADPSLDLPF
jgi:hypothetical protein